MGKTEGVACEYLKADDVFADVLNIALYSGENVVKPENLSELDSTYMLEMPDEFAGKTAGRKNNSKTQVRKYRDILRMIRLKGTDDDAEYCVRLIAGIEQQTNVHYAMPVRDMLYDALEYAEQVKSKAKKKIRLTGAEFLSGMRKNDKLIPVVTIVVYLQPEEWDGPKSLHEMLDFTGIPDKMIKRIPDYEMILLQPSAYEETEKSGLKSTLSIVLGLLKRAGSKTEFKDYIDGHSEIFRELPYNTAAVINEYCNIGIPEEKVNGKEVVDMCKAVEEIREDGRIAGRREGELIGERRGRREGELIGESRGESRGKIMAYMDMGVSIEEIAGKLHITLGEVKKIAAEMNI